MPCSVTTLEVTVHLPQRMNVRLKQTTSSKEAEWRKKNIVDPYRLLAFPFRFRPTAPSSLLKLYLRNIRLSASRPAREQSEKENKKGQNTYNSRTILLPLPGPKCFASGSLDRGAMQ